MCAIRKLVEPSNEISLSMNVVTVVVTVEEVKPELRFGERLPGPESA